MALAPDTTKITAWPRRRLASLSIRVAAVGIPVLLSIGTAIVIESVVSRPRGAVGMIAWWMAVLGSSLGVLYATEREATRLRPLAALLDMELSFPGTAPSRTRVALDAGRSKELDLRLEEALAFGPDDDPFLPSTALVTLAASVSMHDSRSRGHTERVRSLVEMLADEMRLGDADRQRLRWAALLHDVGKLVIHPEILNKRGDPTEEERGVLRQHPLVGARFAAPIASWLGPWAAAVSDHHERYDGAGYPFGLSGEAISLGGRILAVVDAYDVMTSSASPAKSAEAARTELVRCAGTQFDPGVVRAFLAIPVTRLRRLSPIPWLGSLVGSDSAPALASLCRAAAGTAALVAVLGLAIWDPWVHGAAGTGATSQRMSASPLGGMLGKGAVGPHSALKGAIGTIGGTLAQLAVGGATVTSQNGSPGTTMPGTRPTRDARSGGAAQSGQDAHSQSGQSPTSSTSVGPGPSTTTTSLPSTSTTTSRSGTSPPHRHPTTTTTTSPPPPMRPPTSVKASDECERVLDSAVVVTWQDSPSPEISYYEVLRSTDGINFVGIASVPASASSYTDNSVNGETRYTYEVEAVNATSSAVSEKASVTTGICV